MIDRSRPKPSSTSHSPFAARSEERTGYRKMLEEENTAEAETRLENLTN